jgi:hypothetical protein
VAQFGGLGNLARTLRRAKDVAQSARFRADLKEFETGPHFEDVESTRERMALAGFQVHEAKLHTVVPLFERKERYEAFLETVILHRPMANLSESLRREFLEELSRKTLMEEGAYTLDYVRLTVRASA